MNKYMVNVFVESIIVGIICMFVGTIVFVAVAQLSPLKLSKQSTKYVRRNKMAASTQLLISLFLTGFLGHLFFEFTGMNKRLYRWTGVWLW